MTAAIVIIAILIFIILVLIALLVHKDPYERMTPEHVANLIKLHNIEAHCYKAKYDYEVKCDEVQQHALEFYLRLKQEDSHPNVRAIYDAIYKAVGVEPTMDDSFKELYPDDYNECLRNQKK